MIENITERLYKELIAHKDLKEALAAIYSHEVFGRETKSAALGEISEYLIARMVRGQRSRNGNKGFDVVDAAGLQIEVKSRLPGEYRDTLQFNFGKHTESANEVFCICWHNEGRDFSIAEAYRVPIVDLALWATPNQTRYFARTDLRKLRKVCGGNTC